MILYDTTVTGLHHCLVSISGVHECERFTDGRGDEQRKRKRVKGGESCVCVCECLHGDVSLLCVRMGVLYWLPCQPRRLLIGRELVPGHRSWRCLCILLVQTVSTADVCLK